MSATQHEIPGLASRRIALMVLRAVLERGRALDQETARLPQAADLSAADRAFVHLMLKTTLRRLGQADDLLERWMKTPLPARLLPVRQVLRLGLAQLLWLDVPPHAAVHVSVELAKWLGFTPQAGLVNALLQRATREGAQAVAGQDAARLNMPPWLWERWVNAYGEPAARARAEAHLREPMLDLSVKDDSAAWATRLGGEALPTGTVRVANAGDIPSLPGFAEGAWWVQDAAAAMPARLLDEAMDGLRGKRIIDLCAAPGGKTAQLCALGAQVTAVDHSLARMEVLRANLARLGFRADTVVADAAAWKPDFTPDAVLLDAPCSATGTLRRHPDVAWHRKPEDIARLSDIQRRLLDHAAGLLPAGGMLAYAVCSLEPEEGEQQVSAFLARNPAFSLVRAVLLPSLLSSARPTLACPALQNAGDTDGFFMAVLRKD